MKSVVSEYSKYKKSAFPWINEIPENWNELRLKNAAQVELSNADKKTVEGEIPVLLCNYVDVYYNSKINSHLDFMKATAKRDQVKKFTLRKDDVLLTKDSETAHDIGVPSWVEKDLDGVLCGYHLSHIRPYKNVLNGRYLYYSLRSPGFRDHFWSYANGVTRYGILKGDIKNTPIFVPPLAVQDSISSFLDIKTTEIDSLITDKEKLITLLEEKRQAVITEAVTKGLNPDVEMKESGMDWIGEIPQHWDLKKMKYLFEIKKRIIPEDDPTILSMTQKGIRVKDISKNEGQIAESYDKYQKVKIDDFVMNQMDLLTGFVDYSIFEGVTSPDYRVFRLREQENSKNYFLHYLQMCYFRRIFYRFGQGVSKFGRWRLQTTSFKEFLVPTPPVSEQIKITEYIEEQLEEIQETVDVVGNIIRKLKEYRQSLIYEAVTGKIDVREYGEVNE